MGFMPIAIVGRGVVLPGAMSPDALWTTVREGRDLIAPVPADYWPADPHSFLAKPGDHTTDEKAVTINGGVVKGFPSVFDPAGFAVPADKILQLDTAFQWLLHAAREAVRESRRVDLKGTKSAVVIGNLSYPTRSMTDFAQSIWLDPTIEKTGLVPPLPDTVTALSRFSSGLPAHIVAQALDAQGPAFCLDAACASSLFALKYACDYLADGTADVALAASVNACDNIFLHIGFTVMRGLSPSGVTRPFSKYADGLLPAVGAAALCLKRLADAERDGDRIFGVIRGIGLSNDGARTALTPDTSGQVRAMREAYRKANIDPKTISLVECHATGTPLGDKAELESLKTVYAGVQDLPVGSLKSNLGHLVTVAGLGGIVKVTSALAAQIRPPSLHAEEPLAGFAGSRLRVLHAAEPWPQTEHPRRAGVNNFGFGGNNAHVVIEEYRCGQPVAAAIAPRVESQSEKPVEIAICGIGVITGETRGFEDFSRRLWANNGEGASKRTENVMLPLRGLRFPPKELQDALGQHSLIFEAAWEAVGGVVPVDNERSGVFIGMGCDVEAARPGMRWRVGSSIATNGLISGDSLVDAIQQAIAGAKGANIGLSSMPNLPANRINMQNAWKGVGFTVSGEELSGLVALELAARTLAQDELDLALAGAVDLSVEPVHIEAAKQVLPETRQVPADAAIAFVLKRRVDAERCGDPIFATLLIARQSQPTAASETIAITDQPSLVSRCFGHAHAASGLVELLGEIARLRARVRQNEAGRLPFVSTSQRTMAKFQMRSFSGQQHELTLGDVPGAPGVGLLPGAPILFFTAAHSLLELRQRLEQRLPGVAGSVRIAFVADDDGQLSKRIDSVLQMITAGRKPNGPGIYFGDQSVGGELAFVYPELAAPYSGAYRPLLEGFPEIAHEKMRQAPSWAHEALNTHADPNYPLDGVLALVEVSGFFAMLATSIVRDVLGLQPQAALGLSLGETNMLVSFDVWSEPFKIVENLISNGCISGVQENTTIREAWGVSPGTPVVWQNWWVAAPVDEVEIALAGLTRVHLLIITGPCSCVIGGDPSGCALFGEKIGRNRMVLTDSKAALHCAPTRPLREKFRAAFFNKLRPASDIRFYFNTVHEAVGLNEEAVADLLGTQLVERVDIRPTVQRAYADGVRVFLEIGPRSSMSRSISSILEDKPHIAVSLDQKDGKPLFALTRAAATLFAAGVPVNMPRLAERLALLRGDNDSTGVEDRQKISVPAHPPVVDCSHLLEQVRERNQKDEDQTAPDLPESPQFQPNEVSPRSAPSITRVFGLHFDRHAKLPRLHGKTGKLAAMKKAPHLVSTSARLPN
jgi:acyl transferase domain-containing protein